jgi:hypothetical protein
MEALLSPSKIYSSILDLIEDLYDAPHWGCGPDGCDDCSAKAALAEAAEAAIEFDWHECAKELRRARPNNWVVSRRIELLAGDVYGLSACAVCGGEILGPVPAEGVCDACGTLSVVRGG